MEKTNFLASLAERHLSVEDNAMAITLAMVVDADLRDFFCKTALAEAFFTSGGKTEHDEAKLTSLMVNAVLTASEKLDHAVKAYSAYLEHGDEVIVEGVKNAHIQAIFDAHFRGILGKAN